MKRQIFVVRITFLICLSIWISPSYACNCPIGTTDELFFSESKLVFRVRITANELRPSQELNVDKSSSEAIGPEYVRAKYRLLEVFKGKPSAEGYLNLLVYTNTGNCAVDLMTGVEYVIFLDAKDDFIIACSRSFPVFVNENVGRVEKLRKLKAN
ncbi:MAG: hypothetical protein IPN42_10475 [Methylococcaceae bacterium]|nr:hypothetical protein [Methylococcaceae bacterium]